jgi:hypothetical protein
MSVVCGKFISSAKRGNKMNQCLTCKAEHDNFGYYCDPCHEAKWDRITEARIAHNESLRPEYRDPVLTDIAKARKAAMA